MFVSDLAGPFDASLLHVKDKLGDDCFAVAIRINRQLVQLGHGNKLYFSGRMFSILSSSSLPHEFIQRILSTNTLFYANLICHPIVEQQRDRDGNLQISLSHLSAKKIPFKKEILSRCQEMKGFESKCTQNQVLKPMCDELQTWEKIHISKFNQSQCEEIQMMEPKCEQLREIGFGTDFCQMMEKMEAFSTTSSQEKLDENMDCSVTSTSISPKTWKVKLEVTCLVYEEDDLFLAQNISSNHEDSDIRDS